MVQTRRPPTITGEWECTKCGFVQEGTELRRPPKCPKCGAPADALEFLAEDDEDWEEIEDEEEEDIYDDYDADEDDEYDENFDEDIASDDVY